MAWFILALGSGLLSLAIVLVAMFGTYASFDEEEYGTMLLCLVVGVASAAFGLWAAPSSAARYDQNECAAFGKQAEREVRFVRTATFDWSCLVLTDEGWTPRDQMVKVDD